MSREACNKLGTRALTFKMKNGGSMFIKLQSQQPLHRKKDASFHPKSDIIACLGHHCLGLGLIMSTLLSFLDPPSSVGIHVTSSRSSSNKEFCTSNEQGAGLRLSVNWSSSIRSLARQVFYWLGH